MSLFVELKRRNVFRVGLAYAIAAWIILQITDVVGEILELPAWGGKLILLILAVGFPLALIFAWAFEMTPEGLKRESEVDRSESITPKTGKKLDRMIIGILALAVVYLLVDKLVLQEKMGAEPYSKAASEQVSATGNGNGALAPSGPSVAVLPFVNMSDDPGNEYFSDGLTETLLHMLAQLPELRVAARTSSFAFKGQSSSVKDIAETLGVAHILEGSVQKSGDRIRVTAQLIRAADGFHVWSQNYTRPLEDIFAIQDEIATDVAGALDTSLLGGEAHMHNVETADVTAYDLYLKAMGQQVIYSYSSLEIAENFFKQALAADPDFVDAKLGLIRNYFLMSDTGLIDEETRERSATPLLQQVRELQPDNRVARAFELILEADQPGIFTNEQRREQILNDLRNLLPLMPTETYFREQVAYWLSGFHEQHEDALAVIEAGLMVDPLSAELYSTQGTIFLNMEDLGKAEQAFQKAQELEPENPNHYSRLSNLASEQGDLVGLLNWMRKAVEVDPQDHELAARLAQNLYSLRLPEEGDRWARKVAVLAPNSAVARQVELHRSIGREDWPEALRLAQAMIEDEVSLRRGTYGMAVWVYSSLMLADGRAREGYDYLVSKDPSVTNWAILPDEQRSNILQNFAQFLMRGFASPDELQAAWELTTKALDDAGLPWHRGEQNRIWDNLVRGNADEAARILLEEEWSKPLATWTQRSGYIANVSYRELLDRPDVAARKAERDAELAIAQGQVRELLLTPEWSE